MTPSLRLLRSFRGHRYAVTFALLALLAQLAQNIVVQHGHVHRHAEIATGVLAGEHVHEAETSGAYTSSDAQEDDHRHSGDPSTDLQTLGHAHAGNVSPGLAPTWSFHPLAPERLRVMFPALDRPPGDNNPEIPFRPPIT